MATTNTPLATAPTSAAAKYYPSIGYLRAFIVLLVIAHHAALAYYPFAPPLPASLAAQPRWWQAFPVNDPSRWSGAAYLVGFNDIFFMSLMFFLSGLFVWRGLQAKGAGKFLRDRALRLGLPFIGAALVVAPLAYYPTYLQLPRHSGFAGFARQWLSLGAWPSGPAWFVWVLLAFDCIAALLFLVAPRWGASLGRITSSASSKPFRFFALLAAVSAIAYIPMADVFSTLHWTAFGPFTFQTSRIFHYLAYFLIAVGVGAWGIDRGLLAPDGGLARRWVVWPVTALVLFGVESAATIAVLSNLQSRAWQMAMHAGFVLSCAASGFAFLALFLRFAKSRSRWWDSLAANSYGIYLIHYAFVSWLQYAVLPASLPGAAKFAIVFAGGSLLSWMASAAIRRIPAVARVV